MKKVWRELNLEQVRSRLAQAQTVREMMELVLKMKGKEQLTVVMLLRLWWSERNKWREEGRRRSVAELAYIAAFQADLALKNRKSVRRNDGRNRWQGSLS